MTLNSINLSSINFKENTEVKIKNNSITNNIKSDYEKTPVKDSFDKETFTTKSENKKGMSKGLKWLLGLGSIGTIATIAFFALKTKKIPFEDVQKALSEIFEKDFSKEEAENLIKKYTELYKEKDSKTYYNKLVEQLKKDYGIENVNTTLKLEQTINLTEYQVGGMAARNGEITIFPQNMKNHGDESGFNTLFHELKHMQQYAELWKADSEEFLKAVTEDGCISANKALQDAKQELMKGGMSKEQAEKYAFDELYKRIKKEMEPVYKNLQKYEKDSPEYKKGIAYLDSLIKNRTGVPIDKKGYEEYRNLLCEKEAFKCGDNADKLLKYIQQNL